MKLQPTPFTAWLDFSALAKSPADQHSFPIWLESFSIVAPNPTAGVPGKTTYRLRFRKFAGLNDELLLRVFFADTASPTVTAWNEIGTRLMDPKTLGQGLNLPTSETLIVPMSGVDYIDIDAPGDGVNVHALFLSSLQKATTHSALDFAAPAALNDPFNNSASSTPGNDDALLFGRVKATLESGVVALNSERGSAGVFDFDLATQPQLALVTFEILNANPSEPPEISVNNHHLGAAALAAPDLADPAWQSEQRPMQSDLNFHYSGWLKCQKIVPASALQSGANALKIEASAADPIAIRSVELQLKYVTP